MATLAKHSRKRRHRSAILVHGPLDAILHQEEKGKTLLEKETEANRSPDKGLVRPSFDLPLPRATPLRIRCASRVERLSRRIPSKIPSPI